MKKKIQWVKQLTRENTLLDRGLRVLAYRDSISEIGQANMSNVLVVGRGSVTSLYYLPEDYKQQQRIITREFQGGSIEPMSKAIISFLEQGYLWAKGYRTKKFSKREFIDYYKEFNKHHAHSRGAIFYGYWGEPVITGKLKKVLAKKVNSAKIDNYVSVLSSPQTISGLLNDFRRPSVAVEKKKNKMIKELNLSKKEHELVTILSWFTLFYELGELVASYLYDQFLGHLKRIVSKREFEELMWYDPKSFEKYFTGKKLAPKELQARKVFWIIELIAGKWKLLSGPKAKKYYNVFVPHDKVTDTTELKGTTASLGKAMGTVKIVITQADQSKMNEGDILISPMTTPRLMTAIKKAAAIVTDEGGLTAHAAIVSREFNIPCIVGTKFASKIFKDGDKVEVDAEKGIVRKI